MNKHATHAQILRLLFEYNLIPQTLEKEQEFLKKLSDVLEI